MIYNILLINNEKSLVGALRNVLARQENLNVMTANTSANAHEYFKKYSIDLAVLDLKEAPLQPAENPDPLVMLKSIKQTWEYCHVIVFTSITDFKLIYEATRYIKTKYILKDEGFTSLISLINVTLQEIGRERQTDKIVTNARRQALEANDIIKNDIFLQIIDKGTLSTDEWAKKIPLAINKENGFLLVLGAFKYNANQQSHKIAKLIALYISNYCRYEYLIDKHGHIIYFMQPLNGDEVNEQFVQEIKARLETAQENINVSEALSISFIVEKNASWASLKEQVNRAAMLFSVYYGMDDSGFIANADSRFLLGLHKNEDEDILSSLPAKTIKNDIQKSLQTGDRESCERVLSGFKKSLHDNYSMHSYEAQLIYLNTATAILMHIHDGKLVSQLAAETNLYRLTQTEAFKNWGEGFDYLMNLCSTIIERQSNESSMYAKNLVDRVKGHIRKNIFNSDNITLPYIANMVHFNPSYLSRLFKKVTNISISDYIMECKLSQAKHLLADSDTKIQEIAENLGYTSQSNFTRVFKKSIGMTPNDFRSQSHWNGHQNK